MSAFPVTPPIELWGGIECTVNRVGATYFDQLAATGHAQRLDDLDRIAALGIRTVRYPVLWERTAPHGVARADWSWPDARLARLRQLGIEPIVGLVHHGSGPCTTNLLDPTFPQQLAQYARAVAERYPWIEQWTPINEPLTTARFSGLYGHWYPHHHRDASFARALIHQCRAIVLAMRAIRTVTPHARLVQTEDVGKCWTTPGVQRQAAFENTRRWLSWDLLCGRVDECHPFWRYLLHVGVGQADLAWFREQPCPPDILGINYYLTSERFLDDHLDRYPQAMQPPPDRPAYVDTEAVRVRAEGIGGIGRILSEVWDRYHLPLAITEAHLGCTREEQVRWLSQLWQAAQAAQTSGVDVRVVTAWSLFGAYDWHSLVTRADGVYEPGAFDVRATPPRPTALAEAVADLAHGNLPQHPVAQQPGWWQRPERLIHGFGVTDCGGYEPVSALHAHDQARPPVPPILITGAAGRLGSALRAGCAVRGLHVVALTHQELDISNAFAVATVLDHVKPWAVINAAGYRPIDAVEQAVTASYQANTLGPIRLAAACAARAVALLSFSSDQVFPGTQAMPYHEHDAPHPINYYGWSKLTAERGMRALLPSTLIVRTGRFFDAQSVGQMLDTLATGQPYWADDTVIYSPTYLPDFVHACLDLLIDRAHGVWHLTTMGAVSRLTFARTVAELAHYDPQRIVGMGTHRRAHAALQPRYWALQSIYGALLPALDQTLARCIEAQRADAGGQPARVRSMAREA